MGWIHQLELLEKNIVIILHEHLDVFPAEPLPRGARARVFTGYECRERGKRLFLTTLDAISVGYGRGKPVDPPPAVGVNP